MAIYPNVAPQAQSSPVQAIPAPVDPTSTVRGTSAGLAIGLDGGAVPRKDVAFSVQHGDGDFDSGSPPQRRLLRRDSLERREALLKGKEGSRQRRRWENGLAAPVALQTSLLRC